MSKSVTITKKRRQND